MRPSPCRFGRIYGAMRISAEDLYLEMIQPKASLPAYALFRAANRFGRTDLWNWQSSVNALPAFWEIAVDRISTRLNGAGDHHLYHSTWHYSVSRRA
jgi:hypothetical protein